MSFFAIFTTLIPLLRMSRFIPLALILSFFLTSCIKLSAEPANNDSVHVVILGFDGWSSSSFEEADMPFLKSQLPESAWTLHKRSILPSSSACNWATMFKGAGPEAHGYVDWNTRSPVLEVTEKNRKGFFPSVFSVYRESHPKAEMGYLYQWEGMRYLFDMDDFSFVYQFPSSVAGSDQMKNAAIAYLLREKPAIAAFFWGYPDITGHNLGWNSEEYLIELKHIDSIIEDIVNYCVEIGIYDNTLFVITSDHGGHDKTHGQPLMSDIETPFIVFGPGINPGEITEPLMQYDVTSLLADYLHLSQPSAWRGETPNDIFY